LITEPPDGGGRIPENPDLATSTVDLPTPVALFRQTFGLSKSKKNENYINRIVRSYRQAIDRIVGPKRTFHHCDQQ
jgi:hypothetical protein